jgi:ketosteroid isomerase-like protein
MTDKAAARLSTLEQVMKAFNDHDLDGILSHFAEDATFDASRGPAPWGTHLEGKDAIRAAFAARFEAVPDLSYVEDANFVAGDRGVSEWTTSGTNPDGTRFETGGCDLWTFGADDQIVRKQSFWKIVEG